jgi:ATP-dependent Zn protease
LPQITTDWLKFSLLTVGPERKSAFIEEKNREVVAYHEGGHALVAHYTPGLALTIQCY